MSQPSLPPWVDPDQPAYEPLDPLNCPPMTPPPGTPSPADDLPRMPEWADADEPGYDPLRSLCWPDLTPPRGDTPARREWDATLKLLAAAANALMSARAAFVTTVALASRLGVTPGTIRRMVRQKRLLAVKRGGATQSRWYVPASEVDRLTAGRPFRDGPP